MREITPREINKDDRIVFFPAELRVVRGVPRSGGHWRGVIQHHRSHDHQRSFRREYAYENARILLLRHTSGKVDNNIIIIIIHYQGRLLILSKQLKYLLNFPK